MISIKNIELRNFKSFRDTIQLEFVKIPLGLSFITGKNLVNPLLGANGVGKSALSDGLTWLLYGKTSRTLKAGNVCNWESPKGCEVRGTFEKDTQLYRLTRKWNPNTLQLEYPDLSVKTITQEELDLFLGVDFSSFLFSAHIAQFAPKFFELLPSEKLEVFTKILSEDLAKWDTISEKCSASLKIIEQDLYNNELLKASLEGKSSSIPKISEEQIKNWDKEQLVKINILCKEIENKTKQIELFQIELKDLKTKDAQIDLLKQDQTEIQIQVEQLAQFEIEIRNLKVKLETFCLPQTTFINTVQQTEQLKLLDTKRSEYKQIEQDSVVILKDFLVRKEKIKLEIKTLEQIIKNLSVQKTTVDVTCSQLNKTLLNLKNTQGLVQCPLCLQPVSKKHLLEEEEKQKFDLNILSLQKATITKELNEQEKLLSIYKTDLQKLEADDRSVLDSQNEVFFILKDIEQEQQTLKNEIENLSKDFYNKQELEKNKITVLLKDLEFKQADLKNKIENSLIVFNNKKQCLKNEITRSLKEILIKQQYVENEILTLKDTVVKIEQEKNPFLLQKKKHEKTLRIVTKTFSYVEEELLTLKKTFEIVKYWVKGFSKVKLSVLEETIKEVEIIINNILEKIGLVGWKVCLEIGAETKTGNIRDGLTVLVKSPDNDSLVPFEVWSGGEGQRLMLAGTLGIASFIRDKKSGGFDFLFLDEPTQFLSTQGIDDFIEILKEYCSDNKLKGFLIDHRDLETRGDFNKVIKIVKDIKGSNIEIT